VAGPRTAARCRVYRVVMGMLGEMFPGKKLSHDGDEDSDGQRYRPRFDIDLDSGVVRMPGLAARQPLAPLSDAQDQGDGPEQASDQG
jgi:hypothetical protein